MRVLWFAVQIRTWLDTDAAQFPETPILVTSEGVSRLELYKEGELIDTVHVMRYAREELNELLEEMGQKRDKTLTWEKINAAKSFDNMVNNWAAYNDITMTDEERLQKEVDEAAARASEDL